MNYPRLAKVAKKLIEANGRSCSLTEPSTTPLDPTKPWRGTSLTGVVTVDAAVLFDQTFFEDKQPVEGITKALVASLSVGSIDLRPFTVLTETGSGKKWRIKNIEHFLPGDVSLLWELDLAE